MSLSAALNTAKSSLLGNQTQMAIVSRNTAGAYDAGYSRKIASTVTQTGAVQVVVQRASSPALFGKMLGATSDVTYSRAVNAGLASIQATISDTELGFAPVAKIGALRSAMVQFAQSPDNAALGRSAIAAAVDLATGLNNASRDVQMARKEADAAVSHAVVRVNGLLAKLETTNNAIMKQTALGQDYSDLLDQRDGLISQLSEEMGIQIVERPGNDVALYTDSGVTLFDRSPRSVTFTPANGMAAGSAGNAVIIDGVPVTGPGSPMPLQSGNISGHMTVRDKIGPDYQKQLDEIARSLVDGFKETDLSGGGGPDLAGLFSLGADVNIPGSPANAGIASLLSVNPDLLATADGGVALLRDGGVNGVAYRENPTAAGSNIGFSGRLNALVDVFDRATPVDASFGFGAALSLSDFAAASAGWVEGQRGAASGQTEFNEAILFRSSEALSNATGVSLEEETANMLQLEQSYNASAKLLSVINEMMKTLVTIA